VSLAPSGLKVARGCPDRKRLFRNPAGYLGAPAFFARA